MLPSKAKVEKSDKGNEDDEGGKRKIENPFPYHEKAQISKILISCWNAPGQKVPRRRRKCKLEKCSN